MDVYPEGGVSRRRSRAPGGVCGGGPAAAELSEVLTAGRDRGSTRPSPRSPHPQAPSCQNSSPSPQLRTRGALQSSAAPLARGRGCGGLAAAPSCHRQTFLFFSFFPPFLPPSYFRLLPTLEFSIYSSEAQGKCAMFVDFFLYVDHDRNLRVLIFSLLGRGFAWLISLSILAKFVVVAGPWVTRRGSEGQGGCGFACAAIDPGELG